MSILVYNAIQCKKCGDIIESVHRHNYVTCKCGTVSVDGGLDYQQTLFKGSTDDYTNLAVYSDEPFEKVREFAFRLGYGKPGAKDYGELRLTRFKDMTDNHLEQSIIYVEKKHPKPEQSIHLQLLKKEVDYRLQNNIKILEP